MKMTQLTRVAMAAAVVASGLVCAGATVANAAPDCTQSGPNLDGGSLMTLGAVPYKSGPAAECRTNETRSGKAYIWCRKTNQYGNLWYYARDADSNQPGWVYSGDVVSISGSNGARCGAGLTPPR